MEGRAKAIAAVVPGAVPVRSNAVTGVTLVLGTDGKTVTPVAAAPSDSGSAAAGDTAAGDAAGSAAKPSKSAKASSEPKPTSTDVKTYGTEGACIN